MKEVKFTCVSNVDIIIVSCRKKAISPPAFKHRKAPSNPAWGSLDVHFCSPEPAHNSHTEVGLFPENTTILWFS